MDYARYCYRRSCRCSWPTNNRNRNEQIFKYLPLILFLTFLGVILLLPLENLRKCCDLANNTPEQNFVQRLACVFYRPMFGLIDSTTELGEHIVDIFKTFYREVCPIPGCGICSKHPEADVSSSDLLLPPPPPPANTPLKRSRPKLNKKVKRNERNQGIY